MSINTQQLIQASATVVTITKLREGDVYKRVDTESYGGAKLIFGIVTSLMNNGEAGAFTALEYVDEYLPKATQKVFTAESNPQLFLATPTEIRFALDSFETKIERDVQEKQDALRKAEERLEIFREGVRKITEGAVTEPETVVGVVEA